MRESWIDVLTDKEIIKYTKKMCPGAKNIKIDDMIGSDEKRLILVHFDRLYFGSLDESTMCISEKGYLIRSCKLEEDPQLFNSNETLFNVIRKSNAKHDRKINGENYDSFYVRQQIGLLETEKEKAIKRAKQTKDFDLRYNIMYEAMAEYNKKSRELAEFVQRNHLEIEQDDAPEC